MSSTGTRSLSRAAQQRAARAAEVALQQQKRRRRTVLLVVCGVLVAAAVVGIVVGTRSGRHAADRTAVPPGITAAGGIVVGSAAAPVKVIAYEDPQCPTCQKFELANGEIVAAAIQAGKVSIEYRMRSFLGPESVRAVNALAAAQADGRFDALRQSLYVHQPKERTGGFTTQTLLDLGRDVGLTSSSYTKAVRDTSYETWVHKVDDQASRDGNVATPELRIGDRVLTQQELFDPASLRRVLGL